MEVRAGVLEVNSKIPNSSGHRLQQGKYCWKTRKKLFAAKASVQLVVQGGDE